MECPPRADSGNGEVSAEPLGVEMVYALPQRAIVRSYRLSAPSTVADVIALARRDPELGDIDWERAAVGIFGAPAARHQALRDGDRIEIYRPLAVDPKAARRARAKQKGTASLRPR